MAFNGADRSAARRSTASPRFRALWFRADAFYPCYGIGRVHADGHRRRVPGDAVERLSVPRRAWSWTAVAASARKAT